MTYKRNGKEHGFSLVELSVVLVILGLLVGGILGGTALIRAAELRQIETELTEIKTAVNLFKQKYSALPGDMRNATEIWGRADNGTFSGQCGNPKSDEGTGKQTCNGDGNKRVGTWDVMNRYYETFRFWQHLSNAGLLEGNYTGIHGPNGDAEHVDGVNSPASDYPGAGWTVEEVSNFEGDDKFYAKDYGNYLELGAVVPGNCHEGPLFTPEEVAALDMKVDDGMPGRGELVVIGWRKCTTSHNKHDFDGEYATQKDEPLCAISFINAF